MATRPDAAYGQEASCSGGDRVQVNVVSPKEGQTFADLVTRAIPFQTPGSRFGCPALASPR